MNLVQLSVDIPEGASSGRIAYSLALERKAVGLIGKSAQRLTPDRLRFFYRDLIDTELPGSPRVVLKYRDSHLAVSHQRPGHPRFGVRFFDLPFRKPTIINAGHKEISFADDGYLLNVGYKFLICGDAALAYHEN
jgi:hypothetical protein